MHSNTSRHKNIDASDESPANVDIDVASGFGDEWRRFSQSKLTEAERKRRYLEYFSIFPENVLTPRAIGADLGVGSGRWAVEVAPNVKQLYCLDPSAEALDVARENLEDFDNCVFVNAPIESSGIAPNKLDFAYCLGVLHHVPDTEKALRACVELLKPGAPLLVYIYYRFDNRPIWFRLIWRMSDLVRRVVSHLPYEGRYLASQVIAGIIYWPLARLSKMLEKLGLQVENAPLAYYRNTSFYSMRTDALDRFGTRLEKRFTRDEIAEMMKSAGLEGIRFSDEPPYWCAVGFKRD